MRNWKQKIKYILLLCVCSMFLIASCKASETGKTVKSKEVINAQWENAAHTPYGKYPELVTYTLGKIVGSNNANLPVKATYEDNAYTRYLKERLNIQNEDVLEGENSDSYEEAVQILMEDQQLPDLLVVKGRETVKELVRRGMVEDLTQYMKNVPQKGSRKCIKATEKHFWNRLHLTADSTHFRMQR